MKAPEVLLAPISPESPCGIDLRYDPRYLDLVARTRRDAGQEEPKWGEIVPRCEALLRVGIDLRLLALYGRALLLTEGLPGLRHGIDCIRFAVEQHWTGLHPLAAGGSDASVRKDALDPLLGDRPAPPARPDHVWEDMKRVILCEPDDSGPLTLFQGYVALNERLSRLATSGPTSESALRALLSGAAYDAGDAAEVAGALGSLDAAWLARAGRSILSASSTRAELWSYFEKLGAGSSGEPPERPSPPSPPPTQLGGGPARSRADAQRLLEQAAKYFEQNEPGHPAPLLIRRAIRVAEKKDFFEIVEELLPDARDEAYKVAGKKPPDS